MMRLGPASATRFVLSVLVPAVLSLALPASLAVAEGADGAPPPGVLNPQRAWQHWTLNCQGCHRPDGTGSAGTAPSLAGTVAKFLSVPGGATSPLSNDNLAEVLNWMLWRFDATHIPANFAPYSAAEIGTLRARPLRMEASQVRKDLLRKVDAARR
jgi:hypothetical protein